MTLTKWFNDLVQRTLIQRPGKLLTHPWTIVYSNRNWSGAQGPILLTYLYFSGIIKSSSLSWAFYRWNCRRNIPVLDIVIRDNNQGPLAGGWMFPCHSLLQMYTQETCLLASFDSFRKEVSLTGPWLVHGFLCEVFQSQFLSPDPYQAQKVLRATPLVQL